LPGGGRLRFILDLAGRPPWWQMALDEALLELVSRGESEPALRVYTFSPSSVSIGYFQSVEEAVDLEEARRRGVPVVRRFTGGGSVYHSEDGEVTYSIALPARGPLADVGESYRLLCTAVADALQSLGVAAAYRPPNDVEIGGRKVSGNAQARRRGALLQHGTIILDPDYEAMEALLRAPRAKLESHGAASVRERVTGVNRELGRRIDPVTVAEALRRSFEEKLGLETVESWYTPRELSLARSLKEKYRSPHWLHKR